MPVPILSMNKRIGLGIVHELLAGRVEVQYPAHLCADVGQMANRRRPMAGHYIGVEMLLFPADTSQEIQCGAPTNRRCRSSRR